MYGVMHVPEARRCMGLRDPAMSGNPASIEMRFQSAVISSYQSYKKPTCAVTCRHQVVLFWVQPLCQIHIESTRLQGSKQVIVKSASCRVPST